MGDCVVAMDGGAAENLALDLGDLGASRQAARAAAGRADPWPKARRRPR
ncbi:MAG: hypothetical protein ACT4P2_10240 [Pseudomonadota bacterium]